MTDSNSDKVNNGLGGQPMPRKARSTPAMIWDFLRVRKKWWLTPIVLFMLSIGSLLVAAQGSALSPFIYALF